MSDGPSESPESMTPPEPAHPDRPSRPTDPAARLTSASADPDPDPGPDPGSGADARVDAGAPTAGSKPVGLDLPAAVPSSAGSLGPEPAGLSWCWELDYAQLLEALDDRGPVRPAPPRPPAGSAPAPSAEGRSVQDQPAQAHPAEPIPSKPGLLKSIRLKPIRPKCIRLKLGLRKLIRRPTTTRMLCSMRSWPARVGSCLPRRSLAGWLSSCRRGLAWPAGSPPRQLRRLMTGRWPVWRRPGGGWPRGRKPVSSPRSASSLPVLRPRIRTSGLSLTAVRPGSALMPPRKSAWRW